jgi:hypothetical protein
MVDTGSYFFAGCLGYSYIYAPTNDSEEEAKDQFYEELEPS